MRTVCRALSRMHVQSTVVLTRASHDELLRDRVEREVASGGQFVTLRARSRREAGFRGFGSSLAG